MQGTYVSRKIEPEITECLRAFPAVAVLGPRRSGKSTLAKAIIAHKKQSVYLDLERPSDLEIKEAYIVAPVKEGYPIGRGVKVSPLSEFIKTLRKP